MGNAWKYLKHPPSAYQKSNKNKPIYADYIEYNRRSLDRSYIISGFSLTALTINSLFNDNVSFAVFTSIAFITSSFSSVFASDERTRFCQTFSHLLSEVAILMLFVALTSTSVFLGIMFDFAIVVFDMLGLERWYKTNKFWKEVKK